MTLQKKARKCVSQNGSILVKLHPLKNLNVMCDSYTQISHSINIPPASFGSFTLSHLSKAQMTGKRVGDEKT